MFDISFGKLVIVAAVALIVLGPERLPKVARTAGLLAGRLQRYIAGVKAELRQEMEQAEFKKMEQEFKSVQTELKQSLDTSTGEAREALHSAKAMLEEAATPSPQEKQPEDIPEAPGILRKSPARKPRSVTAPAASEFLPATAEVPVKDERQLDLFEDAVNTPLLSPSEHRDRR